MRKLKLFTAVLAATCLLCGCHSIIPEETKTSDAPSESQTSDETTVIKFLLTPDAAVREEECAAVNAYLKEQGREYRVEFTYIYDNMESFFWVSYEDYASRMQEYIDSGNQIDLICANGSGTGETVSIYDYLLDNNYLYCLDEFLKTEKGRLLYDSMPENKWLSLKTDGSLYGVNGYASAVSGGPAYIINKSVMEKYSLTEDDFKKPLSELSELLERVQSGEGEDFYSLWCDSSTIGFRSFGDWFCWSEAETPGLGISEKSGRLESIFENEDFVQYASGLFSAVRNTDINTLMPYSNSEEMPYYDDFFIRVWYDLGIDFISMDSLYSSMKRKDGDSLTLDDFVIVHPYGESYIVRSNVSHTCVWSQSDHREEAFDFLCLLYTDKYLTNLMMYGTDYQLKDGYVVDEKGVPMHGMIESWYYANSFISERMYFEPEDKKEAYYKIYDKSYISQVASVRLTPGFAGQEQEECQAVLEEFLEAIYTEKEKAFSDMLSEYELKYNEAGGNHIREKLEGLMVHEK